MNVKCFRKDPHSTRPFEGLKFADVGCGGGILSEVCIFTFMVIFELGTIHHLGILVIPNSRKISIIEHFS